MMGKPTLADVAKYLHEWISRNPGAVDKCLGTVRWACNEAGMRLPLSGVDYDGDFAITCGQTLAKKPGEWGWKLLGTDAAAIPAGTLVLVFFETDNPAGHIAVYNPATGNLISDNIYAWDSWWSVRVRFVFIPA